MGRRTKTVILGAAGRDFHNFNVVYRDDPSTEVVAFTAAQIPGIAGRRYPPSLSGALYPAGIAIEDESTLDELCRRHAVERVVFAYSDVSHLAVMHLASRALALGADFELLGPRRTSLAAAVPVVAVTAARTGSGKSPLSRWIVRRLKAAGAGVAVVRHPMPYGDLERQACQRFASLDDLDRAGCTAEEREEYEGHIAEGSTVFTGVDSARVLAAAEAESDVIVWDGGNNDFAFFRPDISVGVLDALRAEQADSYHPGEAVLRMADVIVVSKVNSASAEQRSAAFDEATRLNPRAMVVAGAMDITLDDPLAVEGRRAIVVEDGPTITHGGVPFGAGFVAATRAGAAEIIDPREAAVPALWGVYAAYPHIGRVLPAVGYSAEQLDALRETIVRSGAEVVVAGTPLDLSRLLQLPLPVVRARYEFEEEGEPRLADAVLGAVRGARTARHSDP